MTPTRLRVCHIIHSLAAGGAESLLVDLAVAAPGVDMDVAVLSLMPSEGSVFEHELLRAGAQVVSVDLRTRWDPRGLARSVRAVATLQPNVIHTHLKHADLVGAFAAQRLDLPMVSTLHLIEDSVTGLGRAKRWLGAQARIRAAARTVAVSDALRSWYVRDFPAAAARVVTLHNGVVDPGPSSAGSSLAVRQALGVPPDAVMATMVGVMRPGKGHAEVIAAAQRLPGRPDIRLVLAGDGPLRHELERMAAADERARRSVVFAGWRNDIDDLLAASDLVVHPTLSDALPTALIRALAAGVPVVATDVGGVPEVITPCVGVLVPLGDPGQFASVISELAVDDDRRRRMGCAARARFESEFDASVWARRLRSLYEDVLLDR